MPFCGVIKRKSPCSVCRQDQPRALTIGSRSVAWSTRCQAAKQLATGVGRLHNRAAGPLDRCWQVVHSSTPWRPGSRSIDPSMVLRHAPWRAAARPSRGLRRGPTNARSAGQGVDRKAAGKRRLPGRLATVSLFAAPAGQSREVWAPCPRRSLRSARSGRRRARVRPECSLFFAGAPQSHAALNAPFRSQPPRVRTRGLPHHHSRASSSTPASSSERASRGLCVLCRFIGGVWGAQDVFTAHSRAPRA